MRRNECRVQNGWCQKIPLGRKGSSGLSRGGSCSSNAVYRSLSASIATICSDSKNPLIESTAPFDGHFRGQAHAARWPLSCGLW